MNIFAVTLKEKSRSVAHDIAYLKSNNFYYIFIIMYIVFHVSLRSYAFFQLCFVRSFIHSTLYYIILPNANISIFSVYAQYYSF